MTKPLVLVSKDSKDCEVFVGDKITFMHKDTPRTATVWMMEDKVPRVTVGIDWVDFSAIDPKTVLKVGRSY